MSALLRSTAPLAVVAWLGACATPTVDPATRGEPALAEIHRAYAGAVAWAHENPDLAWHDGWLGNVAVHLGGERTFGLCYEWQELVWDATRGVAERVGWEADGITINLGTPSAHYAVVVWDPARVRRDRLLAAAQDEPAFVLDAWRRGEPDVYTVPDWIDIPLLVLEPPGLESLSREYGSSPRFRAGGP